MKVDIKSSVRVRHHSIGPIEWFHMIIFEKQILFNIGIRPLLYPTSSAKTYGSIAKILISFMRLSQ